MRIGALVTKLSVFLVVGVFAAVLVVNTLSNPILEQTTTYHAVFTDAHGLQSGSEVHVAGVRVGTVEERQLQDGTAHITFTVRTDQHVPSDVQAAIHYADLLGARYLALLQGSESGELEPGATIPVEQTQPALDLTTLFNGFQPLFEAIDPDETNELAENLIAVFQGEEGTLDGLLSKVVSMTSTLEGKDEILGKTLENLTDALGTMTDHRQDLEDLVSSLTQLTSYAADHREQIADALDSAGGLAGSLTELLTEIEPDLSGDIESLHTLSSNAVSNNEELEALLSDAPDFLDTITRTTDYGSWVNVYVCNLRVRVAEDSDLDLGLGPHSEVCR